MYLYKTPNKHICICIYLCLGEGGGGGGKGNVQIINNLLLVIFSHLEIVVDVLFLV